MIQATNVLTSTSPYGTNLSSYHITFPRIILAELNTHRMLTKNSASSRAIPTGKFIKAITENPFIPVAWQKNHSGMQGSDYWDKEIFKYKGGENTYPEEFTKWWLAARDYALDIATDYLNEGASKQIANRLLEPFMWHTVLVSGTEWENFFNLRSSQYKVGDGEIVRTREEALILAIHDDPEFYQAMRDADDLTWRKINKGQAEIHMMDLAEAIYDQRNLGNQRTLKEGVWHAPYDNVILANLPGKTVNLGDGDILITDKAALITVSTAIAARTSYTLFGEEKEITYQGLKNIHDKMINADPFHASPFEHPARVMYEREFFGHRKTYILAENKVTDQMWRDVEHRITGIETSRIPGFVEVTEYGWCRNYRGFIQYRAVLEQGLPL